MPWLIVKQPNGKLARFCSVSELFSHVNLTEMQAYNLCRDLLSAPDAMRKVRAGIDDWPPYMVHVKGSGHDRWDDCVGTMRMHLNCNDEQIDAIIELCSMPADQAVGRSL